MTKSDPLAKLRKAVKSKNENDANMTDEQRKQAKSILLWMGDKTVAAEEREKERERRVKAGGDPEDFKADISGNIAKLLEKKAETAKAKVR